MRDFLYRTRPQRVLFACAARRQLAGELDLLGITHPLLLTTSGRAPLGDGLRPFLGGRCVTCFAGAEMHTPVEVTTRAMDMLSRCGADGILSIGGGSTIGLGKALSLRSGLPHLCLPTTYAGSEMTDILGETKAGRKQTRRDPAILPATVIYDTELTLDLPMGVTVLSAMNALAHAVEALYAPDANPVTDLLAQEAIGTITRTLPRLADTPQDPDARAEMLYAAWLCGACLGAVAMSLHHKICHTLGGSFGLPHAETHTVMLPHVLAYNAPAIPGVMARLTPLLGPDPARALQDLATRLGAAPSLRAMGLPQEAIDRAADLALQTPYANPRPVEEAPLRAMLARAWRGDAPVP